MPVRVLSRVEVETEGADAVISMNWLQILGLQERIMNPQD